MTEVRIDGVDVEVADGMTILDACIAAGVDTPTLCYGDTITARNVCRVCVVEVTGRRTLVPACSQRVEPGMDIATDSERVRHARRTVLELLGSSVDLSLTDAVAEWNTRYGAEPDRFGPAAETVAHPAKVDNDLYVRDYSKCILCYQCVDACGEQWQHTFAIAIAGRGFGSTVSTEHDRALPESACVYCGNCIEVCPTDALMFRSEHEMRANGTWDEERQTRTDTVCAFCGVGCVLSLHVQHGVGDDATDRIVKVTSPHDSSVTSGNLCIKGRFGFDHVRP
ncbi:MAG: 2Fe-2S iron-sulfur cluster-binding protein [Actinomycetota bacterium]